MFQAQLRLAAAKVDTLRHKVCMFFTLETDRPRENSGNFHSLGEIGTRALGFSAFLLSNQYKQITRSLKPLDTVLWNIKTPFF